jgi:hypothetical protein
MCRFAQGSALRSIKARAATGRPLGFMGLMAQGSHHQPHHLMMAKGEMIE